MAEYTNAVTDQLVLSLFPSKTVYRVYSKTHELKWQTTAESTQLPAQLNDAIFSRTLCVQHLCNSVVLPVDDMDHETHFRLSFGNSPSLIRENQDRYAVVYEPLSSIFEIKKHLVRPHLTSDLAVLLAQLDLSKDQAMYLYPCNQILTAIVVKDGDLALVNRYPFKNSDEFFYFTMLLVEQLSLPVEHLYVEILANPSVAELYRGLLQNYLPNLQFKTVGDSESSPTKEDILLVSEYLAQCAL